MPRRVQRSRRAPTAAGALVFDRAGVRMVDRLAVDRFGLPSIVLMENAAAGCARIIGRRSPAGSATRFVVFCGPGNNGGDGLAIARHLHNAGRRVEIVLCAPAARYAGDALTNLRVARRMGLTTGSIRTWRRPRSARSLIVIDAILGTGVVDEVGGLPARAIDEVNLLRDLGAFVFAVDLPSGLDADTGEGLAADRPRGRRAVRANLTLAMCGPKAGCLTARGREYAGRCVAIDIGAPRELLERLAIGRARRSP